MVFLSSDPLTNPFSAEVAYLTVLHEIVDSLRDTPSDTGEAASATASSAKVAERTATAKPTQAREGAWTAIYDTSNEPYAGWVEPILRDPQPHTTGLTPGSAVTRSRN